MVGVILLLLTTLVHILLFEYKLRHHISSVTERIFTSLGFFVNSNNKLKKMVPRNFVYPHFNTNGTHFSKTILMISFISQKQVFDGNFDKSLIIPS